ncbi:MAG: hypothetical protein LBS89_01620, partial [Zoogloeaceae bacterium]|nr:hypothetical protein [Zoogloeaceae bacterium]
DLSRALETWKEATWPICPDVDYSLGEFPVRIGGKCHIGELVWSGVYRTKTLRVRDENKIYKEYNITGKRSAIRVEAPAANP